MKEADLEADILPMLHTVSMNTIETFQEKRKQVKRLDSSAYVFPCCNLQRESKGSDMVGVFSDMDGEASLAALEFGSEDIFKGISVVRCTMTDMEIASTLSNTARIRSTLQELVNTKSPFPALGDLLPSDKGQVSLAARRAQWCSQCRAQSLLFFPRVS